MIGIGWIEITVSAVAIIALNILVWVFLWGKSLGKIGRTLEAHADRMTDIENDAAKNNAKLHKKIEDVHTHILPECQETFQSIFETQAYIKGKVDTILSAVLPEKTAKKRRKS